MTDGFASFEKFVQEVYLEGKKSATGKWPRDLGYLRHMAAEKAKNGSDDYDKEWGRKTLDFLKLCDAARHPLLRDSAHAREIE